MLTIKLKRLAFVFILFFVVSELDAQNFEWLKSFGATHSFENKPAYDQKTTVPPQAPQFKQSAQFGIDSTNN